MSGRPVFIGLISFMGLVFLGIAEWYYHYLKKTSKNGKSLMDEAANTQTNIEKMKIGELVVKMKILI